jgi:hypothetical protein
MTMPYRFNQKVIPIHHTKIDGTKQIGSVIGIEKLPDATYLRLYSLKQYLSKFTQYRYKVAYQDSFTKNFCSEWFLESDLIPYIKEKETKDV